MFAQLERLSDENLSDEELAKEIERSKAISEVGKVIVESAKTEVLHMKLTGRLREEKPTFLNEHIEEEPRRIERPPAKYGNSGHLNIIEKYADD